MATRLFPTSEKKFQYLSVFLLLLNLAISVGYTIFSTLTMGNFPGEAVILYPDRTTELRSVVLPPIPTSMALVDLWERFIVLLPFTLLGIFLIPQFLFVLIKAEEAFGVYLLPQVFFWSMALISIPFTLKYSKGIPTLRRIIYVYLTATLIAGMGASLWSPILMGG